MFEFTPIPTGEFHSSWNGIRDSKGVVRPGRLISEPSMERIHHDATWKFPSVERWEKIENLEGRSFIEAVWLNFLKSSSLCPGVVVGDDESLSLEVLKEKILKFTPSRIPTNLYNQFWVSTQVLKREEREIETGCVTMFRASSRTRSRESRHPILSKVLNSQGLYMNLGVSLYKDLSKIHIREKTLIIICLNNLAAVKRINHETAELLRKAKNPGRNLPK